jgi:hypothetical protein
LILGFLPFHCLSALLEIWLHTIWSSSTVKGFEKMMLWCAGGIEAEKQHAMKQATRMMQRYGLQEGGAILTRLVLQFQHMTSSSTNCMPQPHYCLGLAMFCAGNCIPNKYTQYIQHISCEWPYVYCCYRVPAEARVYHPQACADVSKTGKDDVEAAAGVVTVRLNGLFHRWPKWGHTLMAVAFKMTNTKGFFNKSPKGVTQIEDSMTVRSTICTRLAIPISTLLAYRSGPGILVLFLCLRPYQRM